MLLEGEAHVLYARGCRPLRSDTLSTFSRQDLDRIRSAASELVEEYRMAGMARPGGRAALRPPGPRGQVRSPVALGMRGQARGLTLRTPNNKTVNSIIRVCL